MHNHDVRQFSKFYFDLGFRKHLLIRMLLKEICIIFFESRVDGFDAPTWYNILDKTVSDDDMVRFLHIETVFNACYHGKNVNKNGRVESFRRLCSEKKFRADFGIHNNTQVNALIRICCRERSTNQFCCTPRENAASQEFEVALIRFLITLIATTVWDTIIVQRTRFSRKRNKQLIVIFIS